MTRSGLTTGPHVFIDLSFDKIQAIRLAHALAEVGCVLHVQPSDVRKFVQLRRIFGLHYTIGRDGAVPLGGLTIDHMTPETRVGSIARPLILPLAAFAYCRTRWPRVRRVRAAFPGKPTPDRRLALNAWFALSRLSLRIPSEPEESNAWRTVASKVMRRLGVPQRQFIWSEGIKIILSQEGRTFPGKSWNVGYYAALLDAEFVLCPDGDFGKDGVAWTYRFFESALCGAIPVIQNSCRAYDGFRYRSMAEPLSDLAWSREDAEFNFGLAVQRLTVPSDALRAEVDRLLLASTGVPEAVSP